MHQLADFHESLYKQGKSEIALTSTHYAYVQLKQKNIPVYRMNPSYLSIKLGLNVLLSVHKLIGLKNPRLQLLVVLLISIIKNMRIFISHIK